MDFITRVIFLLKKVISGKRPIELGCLYVSDLQQEEAAYRSSGGANAGIII